MANTCRLLVGVTATNLPHQFLRSSSIRVRGGSTWGARGIKPPYLSNTHGYPPKPPLYYLDETIKRKRGGRRREEEKEEESGHDPPLHF